MKILAIGILLACLSLPAPGNPLNDNQQQVWAVLDKLHQRAAQADWEGYFSLYTDNAIFIGTDASEIWTQQEFKQYAKPAFDNGTGWTYTPTSRHIYLGPDEQVAWFDELLSNQGLGVTRGTGVLIKQNNTWKIAQYHLAIPVPNALADDVTRQIKAFSQP